MGILEDVVINAKSAANAVGKSATKLYDLSKLKVWNPGPPPPVAC